MNGVGESVARRMISGRWGEVNVIALCSYQLHKATPMLIDRDGHGISLVASPSDT